jgi:predicted transglutaminase-like cysteine proteinase
VKRGRFVLDNINKTIRPASTRTDLVDWGVCTGFVATT